MILINIRKAKSDFDSNDKFPKTISLECYKYGLDIFGLDVLIFIGSEKLDAHSKLFNRARCEAKCCDYLSSHAEINMFFRDNISMNTIVHECTHACDYILKYLHHEHPNEPSEINACLTAHLVDVVCKAREKHGKV